MKIAIASGKGGTGKTTLAVNLASFLSNEILKENQKITLVDLDVEEPNSGIFIKGTIVDQQYKVFTKAVTAGKTVIEYETGSVIKSKLTDSWTKIQRLVS